MLSNSNSLRMASIVISIGNFIIIKNGIFFSCGHDARSKLGARLSTASGAGQGGGGALMGMAGMGGKAPKGPIKGLLKKMSSKLSCSFGPLKVKGGYR